MADFHKIRTYFGRIGCLFFRVADVIEFIAKGRGRYAEPVREDVVPVVLVRWRGRPTKRVQREQQECAQCSK